MAERVSEGHGDARSAPELVRAIAEDGAALVRQEGELARQELSEALQSWLRAVATIAAAAVLALLALVFLGLALESVLDDVMPVWAARSAIGGTALLLAGGAAGFAIARIRSTTIPEKTKRSMRENLEWAKAQLRR